MVLDSVGKSTYAACKKLLKPGGVYMSSELGRYAQKIGDVVIDIVADDVA